MRGVAWGLFFKPTGESRAKCLIWNDFANDSTILWITLLIPCHETVLSLDFQGFAQNALKKSIGQISYKSTTYVRYCFCSKRHTPGGTMAHRSTDFVHK
jgi:hypothetical protein